MPIRGIPGILKIRIGMCVGGAKDSWFILDCPRNCPHPPPADELGYISFDREAADLLFTVLSLRASWKSTIITSNLTFDRWDEIFGDAAITSAIVDRLTYKAKLGLK